jgi:hypothetical protein
MTKRNLLVSRCQVPANVTNPPPGLLTNGAYTPLTICCGGTLEFVWSGVHGVWLIPSPSCPSNYTNGANGQTQLVPVSNGGNSSLRFNTPGLRMRNVT